MRTQKYLKSIKRYLFIKLGLLLPSVKSPALTDVGVMNIECLITGRRRGSDGFKPHRASDLTHPSYSSSTEASVLPQNTFVMAATNKIYRFCFNQGGRSSVSDGNETVSTPCLSGGRRYWSEMGKKVKSVGIWSKALSYTQSDLHFPKPPHSSCRYQLQRAWLQGSL